MYADKAWQEGRSLFVLIIAIYPIEADVYE